MSLKTCLTSLVIVPVLYGCASQPTEPATPVDATSAREVASGAPPVAAAKVSVAKPADLGGLIRLSSPRRDLLLMSRLAPLPPDVQEIFENPDRLVSIVFGPALGALVDVTAPVDLLAPVWDPDAKGPDDGVFALTLADRAAPTEALRAAFKLHRRESGAIELEPTGGKREVGAVGVKFACELWPSPARDVRGRLVCATDAKLLPTYAPYAARGMKDVTTSSSLWMEFGPALIGNIIEKEERASLGGREEIENPGRAFGRRIGIDFLKDWATSGVGVSLKAGQVELTYEHTFQSSRSTLTVVSCADPTAPTQAPPSLFRMPPDSDMALYFQGAPKEVMRTRGPAVLSEFIQSIPAEKLPTSAAEDVFVLLRPLVLTGGPIVVAHGHDRRGARAALDQSLMTRPPVWNADIASDAGLQKARQSMQGWTIVHLNEPFDVWSKGAREAIKFDKRALFAEAQNARLPGSRGPGSSAPPSKRAPSLVEQPVTPSDGLPAGALHVVALAKSPPRAEDGARAAARGDLHIWLAPEGGATWIALGEDPKLVREKLKAALASAEASPRDPPLGLAGLRGAEAIGMGAFTLAGLVSLAVGDKSLGDLVDARRKLVFLDGLRAKGRAPIPLTWTSEPRVAPDGSQGCRLRFTTRLSPAALGDIIGWFKEFGDPGPAGR